MRMRWCAPRSIESKLRAWITSHPAGHERAAIIYCRRFTDSVGSEPSDRYVLADFRPITDDEVISSSPTHVRYSLRKLPGDFFKCQVQDLTFGFVHSHPLGGLEFSGRDDANERSLLHALKGHNDGAPELIALLLADGQWRGRLRRDEGVVSSTDFRHMIAVGERIFYHGDTTSAAIGWNSRQAAAFGEPFNKALQTIRIGCVGLGGTGSPLVHMAARAGVGEIVIVDHDEVAQTNLNRTHGYNKSDIGVKKAIALKSFIEGIGLGTRVYAFDERIDECPFAIDAISTCDVIFGCTDDVLGRDLLNQALYYYCIPYIDVGLGGRVDERDKDIPQLVDHRARVSTILPEFGACLRCQRVVTEQKIEYEAAIRTRPELAELDPETLRKEFYLVGGGEAAPGVGPFTTAAAQFAFMSFMNLLKPFRIHPEDIRQDNVWLDFLRLHFYSNMPREDPDCFCCGTAGLLNRAEGTFRLGTPAFGRR
jgi:molybdopterin-synthase adenylyltransferase